MEKGLHRGENRDQGRFNRIESMKDETETQSKVMFIDPDMCCSLG
jgi:hypothetical protein